MEGRVTLYDSNNIKIGETFVRRARQLVKQQRAKWVDDSLTAVRFTADAEEWEDELDMMKDDSPIPIMPSASADDDKVIIALAEKRVKERRLILMHTLLLPPGLIMLVAFAESTMHWRTGEIFIAFTSGALLMAYIIHLYQFMKSRRFTFGRKERMARRIAAEVALLKSEMKR